MRKRDKQASFRGNRTLLTHLLCVCVCVLGGTTSAGPPLRANKLWGALYFFNKAVSLFFSSCFPLSDVVRKLLYLAEGSPM
jgi:hypothetical protein